MPSFCPSPSSSSSSSLPFRFLHYLPTLWHLSYISILFVLLLVIFREKLVLKAENESKMNEINQNDEAGENVAGKEEGQIEALELGQLVPMREYLPKDRLNAVLALAAHYQSLKEANGTEGRKAENSSIGLEFTEKMMPGEVDLARLDRQSLGRLEMRAILDRMAGAEGGGGGGGRNVTMMGRQIRQWIRDKLKEEVSQNGFGQQNTTQHRDNKTEEHIRATHGHGAPMHGMGEVALLLHHEQSGAFSHYFEQFVLANPIQFAMNICHPNGSARAVVQPMRNQSRSPALGFSQFRMLLAMFFPWLLAFRCLLCLGLLISRTISFPIGCPSFLLAKFTGFLFDTIARIHPFPLVLFQHQILILRKCCLSERIFLVQFAFIRQPLPMDKCQQPEMEGKLGLIGLDGIWARAGGHGEEGKGGMPMPSNWLWMGQAIMERAEHIQLSALVSEGGEKYPKMDDDSFFLSKIAQIPLDGDSCHPPWDYQSFLRCRPQHPVFLALGSVIGFGLPFGILRFWHQMHTKREQQMEEEKNRRKTKI